MKFFGIALLVSAVVFPLLVSAQGLVPCGYNDFNGNLIRCEPCHFFVLIDKILEFILFSLIPAVAVLMFVVAGAYFLFSQGNPANIQRARDILKSVVLGMIIAYTAWFVLNLFFTAIQVKEWTKLDQGLFQIQCP